MWKCQGMSDQLWAGVSWGLTTGQHSLLRSLEMVGKTIWEIRGSCEKDGASRSVGTRRWRSEGAGNGRLRGAGPVRPVRHGRPEGRFGREKQPVGKCKKPDIFPA